MVKLKLDEFYNPPTIFFTFSLSNLVHDSSIVSLAVFWFGCYMYRPKSRSDFFIVNAVFLSYIKKYVIANNCNWLKA